MKKFGRIVISTLVLGVALAGCADQEGLLADDEPVTAYEGKVTSLEQAQAVTKPCGLWIANTAQLAEARHTAAPTNGDLIQLTLPGGLSCSALFRITPQLEQDWGNGHAVIYTIQAPGKPEDTVTEQDAGPDTVTLPGTDTPNGLGTSPSGPSMDNDGLGTSPSNTDTYGDGS